MRLLLPPLPPPRLPLRPPPQPRRPPLRQLMRPRLLPHAPPPLPSPRRSRWPPPPPAANRWRARPQRRQPLHRPRRSEHGGFARRCALIRQVTRGTIASTHRWRRGGSPRHAPDARNAAIACSIPRGRWAWNHPTATRLCSALGCQQARLLHPGALGLRVRSVRQAQGGDGHGAWSTD